MLLLSRSSTKTAGTRAAAALRQHIGVPCSPGDQTRLEELLDPARKSLPEAAATAAWSEGCAMSVGRAIEEVLGLEATP
jgi:hypothetical protein